MLLRLVDGQDRRPAGGGADHQPPAPGLGQIGQGLGKVEEFFQGVGPVNLILPEQGVIDGVGPGHGFGVGLRGAAALHGAARLEDDHGFGDFPQGVEKVRGPFHPLQIEGDDRGVRVLVEIAENLGLVHVHPVAQRHKAAHPQALGRGHIQEGGAHRAALRGEGNLTFGGDERPGGAHLLVGHIDPLAIGPHHPDAGLPDHLGQFVLQPFAIGAGLGETAGDDDGGLDSLSGALLQGGRHELRRDHHHRQVRGGGRVGDGLIDLEAQDLLGLGVDGVEGAGEAAVFQVGQDIVAQLARRRSRPR